MVLKESDLHSARSSTYTSYLGIRRNIISEGQAKIRIFLSHSHLDRKLIEGFLTLLDNAGISVYVDWHDKEMPRITDRTTAELIKKRITYLDYFLIFATNNAMKSKWVPWETGIADQVKTDMRMAIIPIADNSGNFEGNEYYQLYNRVEFNFSKSNFEFYKRAQKTASGTINEWFTGKVM